MGGVEFLLPCISIWIFLCLFQFAVHDKMSTVQRFDSTVEPFRLPAFP